MRNNASVAPCCLGPLSQPGDKSFRHGPYIKGHMSTVVAWLSGFLQLVLFRREKWMLILLSQQSQITGSDTMESYETEPIQVATKPFISLEICLKSLYPFIMFRMPESHRHVFSQTQRSGHFVSKSTYSSFLYLTTLRLGKSSIPLLLLLLSFFSF